MATRRDDANTDDTTADDTGKTVKMRATDTFHSSPTGTVVGGDEFETHKAHADELQKRGLAEPAGGGRRRASAAKPEGDGGGDASGDAKETGSPAATNATNPGQEVADAGSDRDSPPTKTAEAEDERSRRDIKAAAGPISNKSIQAPADKAATADKRK